MSELSFARQIYRIIACLLALSLLLLAASCDKKEKDGGASTTGTKSGAATQDAGDGGAGSGDASDSDGPGGDGEEADDAFATAPSVSLPAEVLEQIDKFERAAEELPLDDVESAASLLKLYRDYAFDEPVNDALFFEYEDNMHLVCDGLNSVYTEEPPDDDVINDALENGFLYIRESLYSPYFILRPDFLRDMFTETVSKKVRDYLNLLSRHYEYRAGHDFIEDFTLMVSLDQLAEMIVDWENYVAIYPDAINIDDITLNNDFYIKIYIGSIQIENSGLYSVAGADENGETLYKLLDEPRQSYMKFIENYRDSPTRPLIMELYQIYKDNNFLYSAEIEDFFRRSGHAYDLEF